MSTHKWINAVCVAAVILALLVTVLFMNGATLGLEAVETVMGYEQRLFTQDRVHTIDLQVEDWEGFLETCTNEEYTQCAAVIDGEAFTNIGIRAKGNTSLSTVASMDSNRYSFKLEFDQYDKTKSYYGLDKLSLNNLIQDNTLMKDYLSYQLMGRMGAAAPLCSYVYITVNGEDWGLYLAVEAIEESFLQRNYGADYGELYKPDAMSNGGGRGNGKDFNMEQWNRENPPQEQQTSGEGTSFQQEGQRGGRPFGEVMTDTVTDKGRNPNGMGRGSADVKLQYVDDHPDSYSNIFDNAKTDITDEDKARLVASLKKLSSFEDLETVLDMDSVLRYFVVHTFVCNEDSYTGSMIHNYYLYEHQGRLSMLPWDYNLAFGGFQSGNASAVVNSSIDNPMGSDGSDRPMFGWITSDEAYTLRYHQLYEEFLNMVQADPELVSRTAQLIAPYVEQDPTKFCTVEEFETATTALEAFLSLRTESVRQQLAGQQGTVDTGELNLSDMGTMGGGKGGMERPGQTRPNSGETSEENTAPSRPDQMNGMQPPGGTSGMEGGFPNGRPDQMNGMQPPGGTSGMEGGYPNGRPDQMNGMQPPEGTSGMEGGFPNGRPGQMGGMQPSQDVTQETTTFQPGGRPDQIKPSDSEEMQQGDPMPWVLTVLSLAALAAAVLLVAKFKRRK